MRKLKVLWAVLIAAAMFTTPAVARTSHITSGHRAMDAYASAPPIPHHIDSRVGISEPRVGAFSPAPRDGENCDVGDNPRIC